MQGLDLYGKIFACGFRTDLATKERGLCKKKQYKYFSVHIEQTRLITHLLYGFWFIFFSVYSAVFVFRCSHFPYFRVSWFRFMFTLVRHSFASLIHKQLSRTFPTNITSASNQRAPWSENKLSHIIILLTILPIINVLKTSFSKSQRTSLWSDLSSAQARDYFAENIYLF